MTQDAPSHHMPKKMMRHRRKISHKYLRGNGIEIGALHHPLCIGKKAKVRYLDRLDVAMLRSHYPELADVALVDVDIIDNGETLATVEPESQDFLIGNHFLEHTQDPIRTIESHLARVKPKGILYYAIPDKHSGFDRERQTTTFEHVLRDYQQGPNESYEFHLHEWVTKVNKAPADQVATQIEQLKLTNYSIHFHCWDGPAFRVFLDRTNELLGNRFKIRRFSRNVHEYIAVLQKV